MVEKPICIGLLLGLAVLFAGCAHRGQEEYVSIHPTREPDSTIVSFANVPVQEGEYVLSLPTDGEAKRLGTKVFAKGTAHILRSPRDSAFEYYRVGPGTPLFITPTADKSWLQVRMSKGRSGFVRADQTSAALQLALAQQAIADKQRVAPKKGPDSEPDVGDGKGGSPGERDPALDDAIDQVHSAFGVADDEYDRLKAEATGFQGAQNAWPAVHDSVVQHLNAFQSDFQDLTSAIQSLTALSSKLTANERSAYQSIVIHQGEVTDSIQSIHQTLNQMTEGTDWTSAISTLNDNMASLAGAMDGLRANMARL